MPLSSFNRLCRSLLAASALGAALCSAQTPPPGFAQAVPHKLGSAHQSPEPVTFSVGHAKVSFTGRWAPILRGDQTIGCFLDGRGQLEYTSAYAPEAQVLEQKAKDWANLTPVKAGQNQVLTFAFTRARLITLGGPSPAWAGPEAPALEGPLAAFDEPWQKVDSYAPAHLVAAQLANLPAQPLTILEMEGPDHRLLYRYDPLDEGTELLDFVRPFKQAPAELKGWSSLLPLSRQPLLGDPRKGSIPVRFLLNGLDVDLRTEDNRQAAVVVQESILPIQNGMRVLPFELVSGYITDKDVRHLRISKVSDDQGHSLEFDHDKDHLAVRLAEPTKAGVPLILKFEYAGDFLIKPGGDNYWQLGVRGSWYPQPAHMSEESYLFHATVRTKGEWMSFLPGDTVRREKDGEWNLVETRTTQPICFASILGGKYFTEEETREGLTLRIATYGSKGGSALKVIKDQAFAVLGYYKNFLGPYPFKELTIIEKNEWGYGQAPPGMTYITREAFEQISNLRNMQELADMVGRYGGRADFSTMDVRHVLAHELAHQYWGTIVKMGSQEDQWITESFADYCAALFERDFKSQGHFKRNVARWTAAAESAHDAAPIPLANEVLRKDGYESFRLRTGLLYNKGPLLLYSLHQELGDQVFLTWLRSTQTNFRWKFAPTKRVFDLLGFITKKDYTPFYETYFWGTAMPPVK
ncbi:MAG TPA: M1 family aminopeptidase [Holophagaceae bacterium]|nr:M1 family aminopeptidase [Holophagaceae bacterium]